jgi:hypothetical protein
VSTHRTAISAVALTAVITSAFTAAAAAFLSAVAVVAVHFELTHNPGSQIVIVGPVPGDMIEQASSALVADAVTGPRSPGNPARLPATIGVSLQSGILRLAAHGRGAAKLAASSSGSASPGRWLTTPSCCSRTSRLANCDSQTARQIMTLIRSIVHGEGITAIATTYDRALMDLADRVLIMENGQLNAA